MRPFVKVTKDNAWTGDVDSLKQVFIDEPDRLCPALAMGRAEVHVENVQKVRAQADVGTKHSSFFAAWYAQIHVTNQIEAPSA